MTADAVVADRETLDLGFVVVDEFLETLVDARALKTAFELGLIDRLIERRSGSVEALGRVLSVDPKGLRFLLDLLAANRVVEERDGDVRLDKRFVAAMRYRDLLETKLDFAGFTLNDFADLFTGLIRDPGKFTGTSRLFELFDYRRCLDPRIENYVPTRGWMRITTTLTRYEARACLRLHDFSGYRRALDVGGNSGELLMQLCRRNPQLTGTVLDLPLVCEIGMEHVLTEPEHARIAFHKGDVRNDPLPTGFDLVTFKSMLHDWPDRDAQRFIGQAAHSLVPGGTVLIFERSPLPVRKRVPGFSMLPMLLFFRSYREPSQYVAWLEELGFRDVEVREIELDTTFFLVTGRKVEL